MKKALIILFNRFGDLCQCSLLTKSLSESGYEVDIVAKRHFTDFIANIPSINAIWPHPFMGEDSTIEALNSEGYDLLINLTMMEETAILAGKIRAKEKRGLVFSSKDGVLLLGRWSRYFSSVPHDKRHNLFHICDLFVQIGGEKRENLLPSIVPQYQVSKKALRIEDKNPIGIVLGSSHTSRMWPINYYVELSKKLILQNKSTIVLLGDYNEVHLSNHFLSVFPDDLKEDIVDTVGKVPLHILPGLINEMDLVIGSDTGTIHLAAMMGKKVISLFLGPAHHWATGPYGEGHYVVQPSLSCYPCEYDHECLQRSCQKTVTPDDVLSVILNDRYSNSDVSYSYIDSLGYVRYAPVTGQKRGVSVSSLVALVASHLWFFNLTENKEDAKERILKFSNMFIKVDEIPFDFIELVEDYVFMFPLIADIMHEAQDVIEYMYNDVSFLGTGYKKLIELNNQINTIESNGKTTCGIIKFIELSRKYSGKLDIDELMKNYFYLYSFGEEALRAIYDICMIIANDLWEKQYGSSDN